MTRSGPTTRVTIVGSTSPLGKEVRDLLERSDSFRPHLTLLDTDDYAGLLQEFAGKIEVTQAISPERLADSDVALLSCEPAIIEQYDQSGAALPDATVDLTDGGRGGRLFVAPRSRTDTYAPAPYVAPRVATLVLGEVLSRCHDTFGIDGCTATVLEPVSERGGKGIRDLEEQTAGILNFKAGTDGGAQLAFNVLGPDEDARNREARVASEISCLCPGCPAPSVQIATVPIFQGTSFSLHVRTERTVEIGRLKDVLSGPGGISIAWDIRPSSLSPVAVVGSESIHVTRADVEDHGARIWLVADNLRLPALNACRLLGLLERIHPDR